MPNANYDKRHSVTAIATAVLTRHRFIGYDGSYATPSGGVRDPRGISEAPAAIGDAVSLVTGYSFPVEASEPIAQDTFVRPAPDGSGRAAVGSQADNCGRALSAAVAAGDLLVVRFVEGARQSVPTGAVAPLTNIILGDSKVAQNFANVSGYLSGYTPKFVTLGNAALGWPFTLINGGVSSDTTALMLARLPALLAANPGPGWLTVRGGTNDIGSAGLGTTVTKEQIVANLTAIVELGRAAGKQISLCTEHGNAAASVSPINAATAIGAMRRAAFDYMNRWIRATCAANGYPLIDIERAHMDPATGLPAAAFQRTDGIHESLVGSCAEARAFVAGFQGRVPVPSRLTTNRLSARNLLGPVAGGAGAVTVDAANDTRIVAPCTAAAGIPSGWSISQLRAGGGGAGSKVARAADDVAQGSVAQVAMTSTASFGAAGFYVGGDPTNVLARWDVAWPGAGTVMAVGRRINANGCSYVCVVPGAIGGADATVGWSTQEGALVTDGAATFLCQRKPLAGEELQATVELGFDSLVGNVSPRILMYFRDTAGVDYITALCDLDLAGGDGIAGNWLPPSARFVSMKFALPNSNIRYLCLQIAVHGENGSSVNMQVRGAEIINLSQAAAL